MILARGRDQASIGADGGVRGDQGAVRYCDVLSARPRGSRGSGRRPVPWSAPSPRRKRRRRMPTVGRCATAREARPRSHPRFAPCRPGSRSGSCARRVRRPPSSPSRRGRAAPRPHVPGPRPKASRSRRRGAHQQASIVAEGEIRYRPGVAGQSRERPARGDRPDAHRPVQLPGRHAPAGSAVKAADSAAPPASGSRCSARPVLESQITAASRPPSKPPRGSADSRRARRPGARSVPHAGA